jgi:hypothetical protein
LTVNILPRATEETQCLRYLDVVPLLQESSNQNLVVNTTP